jgi:hypothetical protein
MSGIAGILFVSLSLVASAINTLPPAYDQDTATFGPWFAENGSRYRMGHLLAGLAFLLFYFPFFAGFCERMREAEGKPATWTRVTWAGAIMSPAAGTMAGSFITGISFLESDVDPGVLQFGLAANFYAYVVSGAFSGIAMLGAAIIILQTGVYRRWLGWAGLFIGVAAISSLGALVEADPNGLFAAINGIAWLSYFGWIAALSIELIRLPPMAEKI